MKDNEVKIGTKKIGPDTIIQVNLKTLFVFLGIVLSGLTTAWISLNNTIKETSERSSRQAEELAKDIKEIKDQDLKELSRKVYSIDGKMEGIYKIKNESIEEYQYIERNPAKNIKPQLPK